MPAAHSSAASNPDVLVFMRLILGFVVDAECVGPDPAVRSFAIARIVNAAFLPNHAYGTNPHFFRDKLHVIRDEPSLIAAEASSPESSDRSDRSDLSDISDRLPLLPRQRDIKVRRLVAFLRAQPRLHRERPVGFLERLRVIPQFRIDHEQPLLHLLLRQPLVNRVQRRFAAQRFFEKLHQWRIHDFIGTSKRLPQMPPRASERDRPGAPARCPAECVSHLSRGSLASRLCGS